MWCDVFIVCGVCGGLGSLGSEGILGMNEGAEDLREVVFWVEEGGG